VWRGGEGAPSLLSPPTTVLTNPHKEAKEGSRKSEANADAAVSVEETRKEPVAEACSTFIHGVEGTRKL